MPFLNVRVSVAQLSFSTSDDGLSPQDEAAPNSIGDDGTPLAQLGIWSLFDLLCTIGTAIICVALLAGLLGKRRKDEEEEEEAQAGAATRSMPAAAPADPDAEDEEDETA